MINYTILYKNLLQNKKAASFFNKADVGTNGGLGEGRTRVQTAIHIAFYMFILFSLVRTLLGNKQANNAYPIDLDN